MNLNIFSPLQKQAILVKLLIIYYTTKPFASTARFEGRNWTPLLIRGSRIITLTETGMLLKKRSEEIFALYDKIQAEIKHFIEDVEGYIFIGYGESMP